MNDENTMAVERAIMQQPVAALPPERLGLITKLWEQPLKRGIEGFIGLFAGREVHLLPQMSCEQRECRHDDDETEFFLGI
ncbi:MAG: hypothetical protein WB902_31940 [Acetobacteraceae bacterium]